MSLNSKVLPQMQLVTSTKLTAITQLTNGLCNVGLKDLNPQTNLLRTKQRRKPETIVDDEVIRNLIKEDTCQTSRELAKKLYITHSTALRHLNSMGKVQKMNKWVPHELTEKITDVMMIQS